MRFGYRLRLNLREISDDINRIELASDGVRWGNLVLAMLNFRDTLSEI